MKKILSSVLAVLMLVSMALASASPCFAALAVRQDLLGDANLDGSVNVKDATEIQKAAALIITFSEHRELVADADANGRINVVDATLIQKYSAGIKTPYNIGEPVSETPVPSDSELILGTWHGTLDISKGLADGMELDESLSGYFNFSPFVVNCTCIFERDTVNVIYDEDSMVNAVDTMKSDFCDGMEKLMQDEAEEYGLTMQELLTLMGYSSLTEYVETVFEPVYDNISLANDETATYKLEDGKIIINDEAADYTLTRGRLIIEDDQSVLDLHR